MTQGPAVARSQVAWLATARFTFLSLAMALPAGATTATPTQTPARCIESLAPAGPAQCCQFCSPTNTCVPAEGGAGCFTVAAPQECCWTATRAFGVDITSGASGCGDGTVCYDVAPYFGVIGQLNVIHVGDRSFSIGQPRGGTPTNTATPTPTPRPPGHCVQSLRPSGESACCTGCAPANVCESPLGDTGCFDVVADAGCCWSAVVHEPDARILQVISGANGCGDGEVCYRVAFNDSTSGRVSEVTVDDQLFRIGQNRYPTQGQTITPTPTRPLCLGDCNRDYQVRIDELMLGVNIALDRASVELCEAFGLSQCAGGRACVHVIVSAVDYALRGCP